MVTFNAITQCNFDFFDTAGMKHPNFAKRFREACEANANAPKAQEALAKYLGCSGAMVSFMRNGERLPSMPMARKISQKLGVSIDWLMNGVGSADEPVTIYTGQPPELRHKVRRALAQLLREQGIKFESLDESDQIYIDLIEHQLTQLFTEEPGAEHLSLKTIRRLIEVDDR